MIYVLALALALSIFVNVKLVRALAWYQAERSKAIEGLETVTQTIKDTREIAESCLSAKSTIEAA